MKFCYCDETGTGTEPFSVLLGVVVDASRMHVTKDDWASFLLQLSHMVGHNFQELHTRNFYSGTGIWRGLSGQERSEVIDYFIDWFAERKHHIVYTAIDKKKFAQMQNAGEIPEEVNSLWRVMGFHIALAIQKNYQNEAKNKGNTIFVFDEELIEETGFQKLLLQPPEWSDTYYAKAKKQERFCQLVDAPYFANSQHVGLLQVADFLAYFVRRYIEISENIVPEKYPGEAAKINAWFEKIKSRTISYSSMYPKRQRCSTAELFWTLAPECIKN